MWSIGSLINACDPLSLPESAPNPKHGPIDLEIVTTRQPEHVFDPTPVDPNPTRPTHLTRLTGMDGPLISLIR